MEDLCFRGVRKGMGMDGWKCGGSFAPSRH